MNNSPIQCKEIALRTGATLVGDGERVILRVADLESATAEDISFFANPRYKKAFLESFAGAIFCTKEAVPQSPDPQKTFLITESPSLAFQKMVDYFHPHAHKITGFAGIHATAVIHATATIEEGVEIGPYSIIDEGAYIAKGSRLLAHVTIGPYVQIGQNCLLYPQAVVREGCRLGNRVIVQSGAVIGSCGFGYTTNKEGRHEKLAQVGIVALEDDVEIGANTTIDRSRFNETRIRRGTKIDNLVQIGHGVDVGEDCFIIALSGVAGSSKLGRRCTLAAQSGVAGHLTLDDNVTVAAKAGVSKSLKAGFYNGIPAVPVDEYNRTQVYIRKLSSLFKK